MHIYLCILYIIYIYVYICVLYVYIFMYFIYIYYIYIYLVAIELRMLNANTEQIYYQIWKNKLWTQLILSCHFTRATKNLLWVRRRKMLSYYNHKKSFNHK